MSSLNRSSIDLQTTRGVGVKTNTTDMYVNNQKYETVSTTKEQYYTIYNLFLKSNMPEKTANTLTVAVLDVARIKKVNPNTLITTGSNGIVDLSFDVISHMNIFRDSSSKLSILSDGRNRDSYRKREILP